MHQQGPACSSCRQRHIGLGQLRSAVTVPLPSTSTNTTHLSFYRVVEKSLTDSLLSACRRRPRTAEVAEFGSGGTAFLSTPSIFFSLDKDLRAKCKVFDVSLACTYHFWVWGVRRTHGLRHVRPLGSVDTNPTTPPRYANTL